MQSTLLPKTTTVCFQPTSASAAGRNYLPINARRQHRASRLFVVNEARGFGRVAQSISKGFGKKDPKKELADSIIPVWETDKKACPCGSGSPYKECCRQYHKNGGEPSAESLMRARFTAYVKGDVDYIVQTTHPDNPSQGGNAGVLEQDVEATMKSVQWYQLKIISSDAGSRDDEAFVEFQVWFKGALGGRPNWQKAKLESMRERSKFVAQDGKWMYLDGEVAKVAV